MSLNLKGFSQLIEDMGAALQSSASSLIDVSVGSVMRAIFEANASVVLWLQWLILQVLQTTRASTSNGSALDSWMLDFGLIRLAATPSTGVTTFSRFVTNLSVSIPVETLVKTGDGLVIFSVSEDDTNSLWQASSSSYVLPTGVASADLPIVCTTGGSQGNVLAGTITVISASLPGLDLVNNANALTNGIDAEGDQAFRRRFQSYLLSRSRATLIAVQNAIANARQGLDIVIEENTASDGTAAIGSFLVVVDDGSGYPSSDLLSTVAAAVDSVRPIGTTFAVIPPQVLIVNVTITATLAPTTTAPLSIPVIKNYITSYLNSLPIGGSASVTRLAQNVYLAGFGISNLSGIELNGLPSDVVPAALTVIKSGEITVSINGG